MTSIKCQHCGLVNWADAEVCKRCGNPPGWGASSGDRAEWAYATASECQSAPSLFSGAVKLLTWALAGAAVLIVLVRAGGSGLAPYVAGLMLFAGLLISTVGSVMLLIEAFRQSVLWGLGSMFVPFVSLIFLVMFWQAARRSFIIQLQGSGFLLLAAISAAAT